MQNNEDAMRTCNDKTLFCLLGMVFAVRDYEGYHADDKNARENNIKSFHYLFLLFWRDCKESDDECRSCRHGYENCGQQRNFISKYAADKTDGQQILTNIHKHFAGFLASFGMLHERIIFRPGLFCKEKAVWLVEEKHR